MQVIPPNRPLKTVTLEFEDGEIETFSIPEGAGFFKESYSYKPKEGAESTGIAKWGAQLKTFQIYWAIEVAPQRTT